jgi:UDP-N-acetylglucosamine--N-acetylmuramyl-(pentapeptide) pyrophosphoryl-undecaprenol N-acetylglucosamine transferase
MAVSGSQPPLARTRILMVSGGTGGHIFPALAVAQELTSRSAAGSSRYEIEFLGTRRPLEAKLIPGAGFPLRTVDAAGLKGIRGVQRLRNLWILPQTAITVAEILREIRPRVVLGVGGYLAGPVMAEAALARIPTLLIEPNVRPGFTNRMLAPLVRIAALGFAETAPVYGKKARVTGLPVRRAFFEIPPRENRERRSEGAEFTILVVGGSQGASAINQAVLKAAPLLANGPMPLRIVHQTGDRDYNEVTKTHQQLGSRAQVHAFIDDMPAALAAADLVISRAGATAVAELAAAGRAALLIPFPGAADQHQLDNARAVEKAGAARIIEQSELTPERLASQVRELMESPVALRRMETAARSMARPDAAAHIADLVEALATKKS